MTYDRVLLQVGYFITSSPEPQPIEKLMMKLITKAQWNYICRIVEDSNT